MITFAQPDKKFNLLCASFGAQGNRYFVFVHSLEKLPPQLAVWKKIDDANILLVGNVDDAPKGFIGNYSNEELKEMIGLHPTAAAVLRKRYRIAGKGQRK